MTDLFHESVPDAMIGRVWSAMLETPRHMFQVLTKRARRMSELVPRLKEEAKRKGLRSGDHIWLGISTEDQQRFDERWNSFSSLNHKIKFISAEPLLGQIDMEFALNGQDSCHRPSWVIAGGESGPGARFLYSEYARSIRNQCQDAKVPFFFKQWGEFLPDDQNLKIGTGTGGIRVGKKSAGRLLDGREWNESPEIM